jgi:hypothetical protein
MTNEEYIESKIAAMELLLQQGYISLAKYIEFLRNVRKNDRVSN